jgi:hypothetical protein
MLNVIHNHYSLGGCDGCVNMEQVANAGLGNIKARLDALNRNEYVRQFYPIF